MKYFFVSDIHGQYDKLIDALQKNNFNEVVDTLVVLGDSFDRGTKSLEVLKFILSCRNHTIVLGNHDLRLKDLILNKAYPNAADVSNGVLETLHSFCGDDSIQDIENALCRFVYDADLDPIRKMVIQYLNEGVYALEWDNLIATHGWLPTLSTSSTAFNEIGDCVNVVKYEVDPNWRNATKEDWERATWAHSGEMFSNKAFTDKTLIVGHWHAWRLRRMAERGCQPFDIGEKIDFSTFIYEDKLIAIDGCTNATDGLVNVFVYENDAEPDYIIGKPYAALRQEGTL